MDNLAILILILLFIRLIYLWFFRRISSLSDFEPGQTLSGKVVSVPDGDGFEFFHVPMLSSSEYNGERTLRIRLAGIDAPETGNPVLGKPAQPFSVRAKETLEELVLDKTAKLKLLKIDQYRRILATCYVEDDEGSVINVNKKMVELGMACVYEGKDAIYDDYEEDLLMLEQEAYNRKIGIWSRGDYESPMDYKRRFKRRN